MYRPVLFAEGEIRFVVYIDICLYRHYDREIVHPIESEVNIVNLIGATSARSIIIHT